MFLLHQEIRFSFAFSKKAAKSGKNHTMRVNSPRMALIGLIKKEGQVLVRLDHAGHEILL